MNYGVCRQHCDLPTRAWRSQSMHCREEQHKSVEARKNLCVNETEAGGKVKVQGVEVKSLNT